MSVVNDNDSSMDSKYYFDKANIFCLEGKYEEAIVYTENFTFCQKKYLK